MTDNRILIVGAILQKVAEELDIPPSKYEQAVTRYTSVGEWLERGEYPGIDDAPSIYPQGSFRLGTVVRPLKGGKEGDYDIDLVCQLSHSIDSCTPRQVKHSVGDRLKAHGTYAAMLDDEGRRCWTLLYAEDDGIGFHMDVLPSIPNPTFPSGVPTNYAEKGIEITNRETGSKYSWKSSNPAGYAEWFADCQTEAFERIKSLSKTRIRRDHPQVFASIDSVPDQLVRTPLQRVIQLLKRHRDTRFSGHELENDKPISMIITTLTALAYRQEVDIYSSLANFLDQVRRHDKTDIIQCMNGEWRIPNPVDPEEENFADRWNDEGSRKPDAFFQWIDWIQQDLDEILNASTASQMELRLCRAFGDGPGKRAAAAYSGPLPGAQQPPKSLFGRVAGLLRFDVPHKQAPSWNFAPLRFKVSVSAKYYRKGFRPRAFGSNSPPLPKHVDIIFEADTDAPRPYKVFWQVVNTGDEASQARQLRGDFYESEKSGRTRKESTRYTGMHWVECFVVKNGVCVARSGEFVVNISSR